MLQYCKQYHRMNRMAAYTPSNELCGTCKRNYLSQDQEGYQQPTAERTEPTPDPNDAPIPDSPGAPPDKGGDGESTVLCYDCAMAISNYVRLTFLSRYDQTGVCEACESIAMVHLYEVNEQHTALSLTMKGLAEVLNPHV